ncbi:MULTISPECIES: hypothetical protein [unclassified Bradyrhizobium]|uniref:hypothetical protein n=1 Tax=unclassified Bradyrhizobium TaxID=2631580 RepID=UPI002915CD41|nr:MULTISPECIES: hypothetical protein [unclassified Bradyrhizobium]
MGKNEELTLAEQMCRVQIVDGKKMITVADSVAQIDLAAEFIHEEINGRDLPPDIRAAMHAQVDEKVLRAKEAILREVERRTGGRR